MEVFAVKATEKNNTIILQNPVIVYNDYIIQAKKGIVKNKKKIYLNDNVVMFYKNTSVLADKAVIYAKNNILISDIFLIDKSNDIWIKSNNASLNGNVIQFKNMRFSSCCVKKPDWFLYSSSGEYNKKTKYISLHNMILYVGKVPVFYFPFYANSLNKKRRSGFLRPYVGFSVKEGILYSQPYYIVLGQRADDEITPTIRTFRGRGIYNTFRFVDSPYSFGQIRIGEFVDYDKYYLKNSLANKKHYGFQFDYKRDKVFSHDKLYMQLKYANDVDYFYLNPYNYTFNTVYLVDKLITSKINYINEFAPDYIAGIYAKYFIDTTKINNDSTIQILPQVNLHKFETKKSGLLTSFDFNYYNYYSKYQKYYKSDFDLPVSADFSFFNNYLKMKVTERFNYLNANYYNSQTSAQYFYQAYSALKFYTSLSKGGDYIHIINPSLEINIKQLSSLSKTNNLLNYTKINNSLNLSLFQIFQKGNFYLDHTVRQNIDLNLKNAKDMENILNVKLNKISVTENNKYNWQRGSIDYNSFSIGFPVSTYYLKVSHLYSYSSTTQSIQTYTFRVEKNFNKYKKAYFEYNYDMENRYIKYMLFGVALNKKCWQYNFSLEKSRIPVLKENGISYNNNYMLTLNINFYPIGGLKQTIQLK